MRKLMAVLIVAVAALAAGCGGGGMRSSVAHLCAPDKGTPAYDVCVQSGEDMTDAEINEIEQYIKDK
jgi:hypothetical protein